MKKTKLRLYVGILFLVLLGLLVFTLVSSKSRNHPGAESWKTYDSEDYGFKLQYPDSWVFSEARGGEFSLAREGYNINFTVNHKSNIQTYLVNSVDWIVYPYMGLQDIVLARPKVPLVGDVISELFFPIYSVDLKSSDSEQIKVSRPILLEEENTLFISLVLPEELNQLNPGTNNILLKGVDTEIISEADKIISTLVLEN